MRNLLVVILFCFSYSSFSLSAEVNRDSLERELSKMPVNQRLETLSELAYDRGAGDNMKYYADRLLEESEQAGNDMYVGNALLCLLRYYYAWDSDSLLMYLPRAEALFTAQKRYDELFRVKGWYIYSLSRGGENDSVVYHLNELRELVDRLDYPEGLEMVEQAEADFYISKGLVDQGLDSYEQVLNEMEKRGAPLVKRMRVLRNMLNLDGSLERRKLYIIRLKALLDECQKNGIKELDENTPLYYVWYVYHRSSAFLAIDQGDVDKAREQISLAEKLVAEHNMRDIERVLVRNLRFSYYCMINDYENGVALADDLIKYYNKKQRFEISNSLLRVKGILCRNTGHYKEASDLFYAHINQKDSLTNSKFYEDLATLYTIHKMDKLELSNKKMELDVVQSRSLLWRMAGVVFFLVLICCFLSYFSYIHHRYGLRLKRAKEKAEESDRLKSVFLANMNHEIRTPLNAIVGFSQVLVEEEDPEERRQFAEIIFHNNELLQQLIADVLDISRIESNSMPFVYGKCDLRALMNELKNMVSMRMPESLELQLEMDEALVMETDRNRLTQILVNLLNNAIKHTQKGFIQFGYRKKGESVEFFVRDTGEGIPADKVNSIFSRFVKLDNWSTGVGLGLAICSGLVGRMGGEIWVTSELGVGSTFFVKLPLVRIKRTTIPFR